MQVKLAASDIGWKPELDDKVYRFMAEKGFTGLEIAPTRIFPECPYEEPERAAAFARELKSAYGFEIVSMQSIWYGMPQRIAESEESRNLLFDYTVKALRFAEALGCRNIVFGCPRNRSYEKHEDIPVIEDFLLRCAEAALERGAVIALEANPPIYHTNFINRTSQALELIKLLAHPALKLNLDFGTVIENSEDLGWIPEDCRLISHVHISEPSLVQIRKRSEHEKLITLLKDADYSEYVSIEMGSAGDIFAAVDYLSNIAGESAAV